MRVFVTGASGWIGSAVVDELVAAGHDVIGLVRSDEGAAKVTAAGAEARRGDLDDLDTIRAGAEGADGVVHLAFKHDFTDFAASGRTERAAVETIGKVLEGSDRPFLFASGLPRVEPARPATEEDASPFTTPDSPRGGGEHLALSYAERGVRPVGLRFPTTVHGRGDHGFVAQLVRIARERGVAGYVGDGTNHWPAVHRSDAAAAVALALTKAPAGSVIHPVAEQGIETRVIAEAIGSALGVPTASVAAPDAEAHFGWLGPIFAWDVQGSSAITRERLGWAPTGPTLLEDLDSGAYTS